MGGGGPADDGGSGNGSHLAIVPSGEGPSLAPSPSTPSGPSPSLLPHADREALLRWIESNPFVFVDRQHHESARARLVEAEGAESTLRRLLAEVRDAEKAAEEALQRANAVVGDLTSRAVGAEARIEAVRLELQGRDSRIRELESQVAQLTADLEVERADRNELVDQLDDARQAAQGLLEELSQNVGSQSAPAPRMRMTKLTVAEAEVARLKTQLELTEEAVRVERLRNFADGSNRAAWDVERTKLQRDVDFARESRDQGKCSLSTGNSKRLEFDSGLEQIPGAFKNRKKRNGLALETERNLCARMLVHTSADVAIRLPPEPDGNLRIGAFKKRKKKRGSVGDEAQHLCS
ncbi:hypothetical protein R1sor_013627 [Riccia sorocarpa]|uniref:Uncharacterized protein n=1 Tax=Riccia sorocarpa TaxID=122646 RepID=A0ABD3H751_9MARC